MAAVQPDLVQDIFFGAAAAVAGFEVVSAAVKKIVAPSVAFFVLAASLFGLFYL